MSKRLLTMKINNEYMRTVLSIATKIFIDLMKNKKIESIVRHLYQIIPFLVWFYYPVTYEKIKEYKKLFTAIQTNDVKYLEEHRLEEENFKAKTQLSLSAIEASHKNEIERKKTIEDKAKANLLAITVSVSLMLGTIGLILKNETTIISNKDLLFGMTFMFSVGVLYFLWGGLAALSSIRTGEFGEIFINDEVKINGDETKKKAELVNCIELNTILTMERSNYIDSSYVGIRNGIICLVVFFILMVVFLAKVVFN